MGERGHLHFLLFAAAVLTVGASNQAGWALISQLNQGDALFATLFDLCLSVAMAVASTSLFFPKWFGEGSEEFHRHLEAGKDPDDFR